MNDETEVREPEVRTAFNEARQAAELIPVGGSGVELQNFAQQVDMAKWISKSDFAIPKHLRGNVGACLAVLEISKNTGLSPYGVANATYVQNDRLCFESKLVHAIVERSGLLRGRLSVRYEGEGDDLKCYVAGTLKGQQQPSEWPLPGQAPTLKDLHPGHSTKDGRQFVKGSPLWDRKAPLQMFYDCCRDWARVYTPEALLGIYTADEIVESAEHFGPDAAKDITPDPGAALHERLKQAGKGTEGFRDGVVEAGLAPEQPESSAGEAGGDPDPNTPEPQKRTRARRWDGRGRQSG